MSTEPAITDLEDLGEPLAAFKVGAIRIILFWICGLLLIAAGTGLAGLAVYWLINPPGRQGGGGQFHDLGKLGVFAVFLLGCGAGMFRAAWRSGNMRFLAFEDGLTQLGKEQIRSLRWDQVCVVLRNENPKSKEKFNYLQDHLAVTARDGTSLRMGPSVSRYRELRRLIEERTLPYLLAGVTEQMRNTGTVQFGSVKVDAAGIRVGMKQVPWENLARVYTGKGQLHICTRERKKPVISVALDGVPNVHVLLALASGPRPQAVADKG
jgi:hypothetical protein